MILLVYGTSIPHTLFNRDYVYEMSVKRMAISSLKNVLKDYRASVYILSSPSSISGVRRFYFLLASHYPKDDRILNNIPSSWKLGKGDLIIHITKAFVKDSTTIDELYNRFDVVADSMSGGILAYTIKDTYEIAFT